jgi:hypothetical protein
VLYSEAPSLKALRALRALTWIITAKTVASNAVSVRLPAFYSRVSSIHHKRATPRAESNPSDRLRTLNSPTPAQDVRPYSPSHIPSQRWLRPVATTWPGAGSSRRWNNGTRGLSTTGTCFRDCSRACAAAMGMYLRSAKSLHTEILTQVAIASLAAIPPSFAAPTAAPASYAATACPDCHSTPSPASAAVRCCCSCTTTTAGATPTGTGHTGTVAAVGSAYSKIHCGRKGYALDERYVSWPAIELLFVLTLCCSESDTAWRSRPQAQSQHIER